MNHTAKDTIGINHPWANDKFAIGPPHAMTLYSNLINNLTHLITPPPHGPGTPIQPEILLKSHLDHHRLRIKELGRELRIIR
jgi:hypothetical protein